MNQANHTSMQKSMFFAAVLVASQWSAHAADINFLADATVARGLVRLGDVAEIITGDAEEARLLAGIALVPAPDADLSRLLKRQEVQQLLQLSGVTLREHRFGGAEATQIHGTDRAVVNSVNKVVSSVESIPVVAPSVKIPAAKQSAEVTAAGRISQAIVVHLNAVSDISADWQAEVAYSPRVAQALGDQTIVRIEGGVSPWLGRQEFMVLVGNPAAPTRLPVEAEVTGTARAAAVVRPIERGAVILADDLQMQTVSLKSGVRLVFDPNQVIGRESTRALNAGQMIGTDMVRVVRQVKRGELIDVFSVGASVLVKEPAKALTDGGEGDSITVEFADRRKMTVRVTGTRRAEVYAMQTSRSQVNQASASVIPVGATSPLNRR